MNNSVATGMEGFTSALGTSFTADSLFGAVSPLIPFIAIVTLFALTWGVFNKYRNKSKRGK